MLQGLLILFQETFVHVFGGLTTLWIADIDEGWRIVLDNLDFFLLDALSDDLSCKLF